MLDITIQLDISAIIGKFYWINLYYIFQNLRKTYRLKKYKNLKNVT